LYKEIERITKDCIERKENGIIKSNTDLYDEIANKVSLIVEHIYEEGKNWIDIGDNTKIDNSDIVTQKLQVKNGNIYRTITKDEIGFITTSMCFVPD